MKNTVPLLLFLLFWITSANAFLNNNNNNNNQWQKNINNNNNARKRCRIHPFEFLASSAQGADATTTTIITNSKKASTTNHSGGRRPCFFKTTASGKWKQRIELNDLEIGQELVDCSIVQELLDAKKGPKVFCECGVGRCSTDNTTWKIVTGVLRLDTRKQSVARKKLAKLKSKKTFTAYVSQIRPDNHQFEICLGSREEAFLRHRPKQPPVSSLQINQEVIGTVVRLESYGAFVDVGVNRVGLLHISKMAAFFNEYIQPTKEGFAAIGIERGAKVRLQVAPPSTEKSKKRLFLDFTNAAKQEVAAEQQQQPTKSSSSSTAQQSTAVPPPENLSSSISSLSSSSSSTSSSSSSVTTTDTSLELSEEEEAAWAAHVAAQAQSSSSDDEEEEDDEYYDDDDDEDYDEDRDIEDALGLGTY